MFSFCFFLIADPARVASHIAKAVCVALLPHLAKLKEENLSPIAVRVCLDPENVSLSILTFIMIPGNYKADGSDIFIQF